MTKISQLSSVGSSLNVADAFVIQTPGDISTPNKKVTVSGLTTYLNTALNISLSGVGISDGDKGDITVSASGATWTIDDGVVTYAKIQNVSATDRILGRSSAGSGVVQEIICTAAGRALIDDADAAAQRTTLGLGTLATQSGTFSGTSSGTNTGDQNLFSTIVVSGQSNVVADATSDTLTLVAGSGITITTNATTDTVTFASTGGSSGGAIVVPSGTAASPSISASGDSDTGIFFPSGNTLGIATEGVERIRTGSGETKLATDLKLDDGGTYTTTVQTVTATADRTISFPDLTGTVALVAGSNGQVPYNASGVLAGSSTTFSPTDGTRFIVPFGYGTGAGGAVTQATNKSTAVTLNANCGQITMHNATLSGDTTVSFGLSNSTVASGDVLVLNHVAGGTFGSYLLNARTVASSGTIDVRNITGSGLGEAIVIGFAVIKATIS